MKWSHVRCQGQRRDRAKKNVMTTLDPERARRRCGTGPGRRREGADMSEPKLDERAINTIRFLSVDAVQQANSGHPGLPMGAAAMAYVLWGRFLRHNPRNPCWPDRDRFVLSAGHGSMLLYSLLHLTGYDLPLDQIKRFRQWGSLTPGHPESDLTPGRGSDDRSARPRDWQCGGHGDRRGASRRALQPARPRDHQPPHLRHRERRRHDGGRCSPRPASLAGDLKLGKLIVLYDDNGITLAGTTSVSPSPRTWAPASRPTAGTCSRWTTATTWPRSTRRSAPRSRSATGRR